MIRFQCPHCRTALQADEELAGRSLTCSHCRQKLRVPGKPTGPAGRVVCVCAGCKATFAAASKPQPHRVQCPKCGTRMRVPGADQVTADGETLRFTCEQCGQVYCVLAKYAGKKFGCLVCKSPCRIPQLPEPEPEPAADGLGILAAGPPPGWEEGLAADLEAAQQRRQPQEPEEPAGFDVSAIQMPSRAAARTPVETGTDWRDRLEALPFVIRIPMGMVAGLALALVVGAVWAGIAKATGLIFCWLCVPAAAAAAYGLMPFVRDRNVGVGLFAAFLGLLGIVTGKAMIATWAVAPLLREEVAKHIEDPGLFSITNEDVEEMVNDPDAMFGPVCLQLAEEQNWDRAFVIDVFRVWAEDGQIPEEPLSNDIERVRQAVDEVDEAVETWPETRLRETARRQGPELMRLLANELVDSAPMQALGAGIAFLCSFALWDLILIPIALGTAFKIGNDS